MTTWVCDTHQFDVICRRSPSSPVFVRPLLGIVMNAATRAIVGWKIQEPGKANILFLALNNAVAHNGRPQLIYVDGGHRCGRLFRQQMSRLGIEMSSEPSRTKSIERWLCSAQRRFEITFKSYCGGDFDRSLEAIELAKRHPDRCPTIDEFKVLFSEFVARENRLILESDAVG